jgi:hypothetical protein
MACHTQEAIADAVGCDKASVSLIIDDLLKKVSENQTQQTAANHATDFTPPIYNVWKQQTKTEGNKCTY